MIRVKTKRRAALWLIGCVASAPLAALAEQQARVPMQPVTPIFHFQTRISQARLPHGNGTFEALTVELRASDDAAEPSPEALCSQSFEKVMVEHGVLNLRLDGLVCSESRGVDEVMAQTSSPLELTACFGPAGGGSCLEAVPLASVAFSIASNMTSYSMTSHSADLVGRSVLAYRTSGSATLLENQAAVGYFDFATYWDCGDEQPDVKKPECGLTGFRATVHDGFITWVPTGEAKNLNISSATQGVPEDFTAAVHAAYQDVGFYAHLLSLQGGLTVHNTNQTPADDTLATNVDGVLVIEGNASLSLQTPNGQGAPPLGSEAMSIAAGGLGVGTKMPTGGVSLQVDGGLNVAADITIGSDATSSDCDWNTETTGGATTITGDVEVTLPDFLQNDGTSLLLQANANTSIERGLTTTGPTCLAVGDDGAPNGSVTFCRGEQQSNCPEDETPSGSPSQGSSPGSQPAFRSNLPTEFVADTEAKNGAKFYGEVSFTNPVPSSSKSKGLVIPRDLEFANNIVCDGCIGQEHLDGYWSDPVELTADGSGDEQSLDLGTPVRCIGKLVDHADNEIAFDERQWGYAANPLECLADTNTAHRLALSGAECALVSSPTWSQDDDDDPTLIRASMSLVLRPLARCCPSGSSNCTQKVDQLWCGECNNDLWEYPTDLKCTARCFYVGTAQ